MEASPHSLVASERKGNVRDAATDLTPWANSLDLPRRTNKVNRIVVVLSKTSANSQDVWIKYYVVRSKAYFLNQNAESSLANANLVLKCCSLTFLIKGHHNHRSAVIPANGGVVLESLLALLQGYRVYYTFALGTLQSSLNNMKLRGVYHEWHLAHIRLRDKQVHKLCHGRYAVNKPVVHVDVKHVSTLLHLLAGYPESLLVVAIHNRLLVHYGTSNIASLTHVQESAPHVLLIRGVVQGLKATQTHQALNRRRLPWLIVLDEIRNLLNVVKPRATAPPKHVHKATLNKWAHLLLHLLACLIVATHAVWQTSIWIRKHVAVAAVAQVLNIADHVTCAQSTVQANSKRLGVLDTVPERLVRLPAQGAPAVVHNGATHKHRETDSLCRKILLNGVEGSLRIQGVKDRLNKQHIHATSNKRVDLNCVCRNNLVKGHITESRVLHRWGYAQGPVRGTNRTTHKTRLGWVLGSELLAALLGNLCCLLVDEVDFLLGLQLVICLGNGGSAKSIGLDEISSNLKELAVDLANNIRASDHKNVIVALQRMAMVRITLTLEVRLVKLVLLNGCTHSTINH